MLFDFICLHFEANYHAYLEENTAIFTYGGTLKARVLVVFKVPNFEVKYCMPNVCNREVFVSVLIGNGFTVNYRCSSINS